MRLFSEHWFLLPWEPVVIEGKEFLIDNSSPVGLFFFFFSVSVFFFASVFSSDCIRTGSVCS